MVNTGMQIADLMKNNGKSAPDMTHALAALGNGNMQAGFARIGEFYKKELSITAAKSMAKGRIQGGVVGIAVTAFISGIVYATKKISENRKSKLAHETEGKAILQTLMTEESPKTANQSEKEIEADEP